MLNLTAFSVNEKGLPVCQGLVLSPVPLAALPVAASLAGAVAYVSDGDAGAPCLAVSNGANWKKISLGASIA